MFGLMLIICVIHQAICDDVPEFVISLYFILQIASVDQSCYSALHKHTYIPATLLLFDFRSGIHTAEASAKALVSQLENSGIDRPRAAPKRKGE